MVGIILAAVMASGAITSAQTEATGYKQTNLISDIAGLARYRERTLVNPWGMASGPVGPYWIANQGTDTLTSITRNEIPGHDADGRVRVAVPARQPVTGDSGPTGIVYSGTPDFIVTAGGTSAAAELIIVTLDGRVMGWSSVVDPNTTFVLADNSASGAEYTGVAVASSKRGDVIALANFGAGTLDILDSNFELAASVTDPALPAGFSPFNVQNIGGQLFVTFAKRGEDGDEIKGAGLGYVDVFDVSGVLIRRFASGGTLNAPWGIELAPSTFGEFGNQILIGNFGDGRISAFNTVTGEYTGQLKDRFGLPIAIDGLWGLMFGTIGNVGRSNILYFSAGIADETHGLVGTLTPR